MPSNTIRIRAKDTGGVTTVKALISHPMSTGLRKNKKTGKKIPAHFIQQVKCDYKGTAVMTADWGIGISKNPYLSFQFTGAKPGDSLTLSWVDNEGESDSKTVKIG